LPAGFISIKVYRFTNTFFGDHFLKN